MKRWLLRGLAVLLIIILLAVIAGWVASEPRPVGTSGEAADALARRIEVAVGKAAWDRTGAVSWNFDDREQHLWDRTRGLARVRWSDVEVLLDLTAKNGIATKGGVQVEGEERAKLIDRAWARWVNDSFWLNPLVKLFDEGTERTLVKREDGSDALLISYASGGVTPGDAYLWIVGPNDLPTAWKMWVKIIPIGGAEFSWDGWETLGTGAKVATLHESLLTLHIKDVKGAATLSELEPNDPFAPLYALPSIEVL